MRGAIHLNICPLIFIPSEVAERCKPYSSISSFLSCRCRVPGPYGYTAFFTKVAERSTEVSAVARALNQVEHLLIREPALLRQHLQNALQQWVGNTERVAQLTAPIPCAVQWLRLTNAPPLGSTAELIRTLNDFEEGVTSLAVAPDGEQHSLQVPTKP